MTKERKVNKLPYTSSYVDVNGVKIHYLEAGSGKAILFLHGMPASSYLWRDVLPYLISLGHCIAPDLVGFGKSDKPDIAYTVHDHIKFINQFISALGLKDVLIVMHGFGSLMGLDYALHHENNCRGLVFYEAFLRPMQGEDVSLPLQEQTLELRDAFIEFDPAKTGVHFVDQMILQEVMSQLSDADMAHYREPFLKSGTVKPIMQYSQDAPCGDGQSEIDSLMKRYSEKLVQSRLPKLLLYSIPGFITTMATVMWAKEHLKNLELIDVGEELHLGQESNPAMIGESISIWLQALEQSSGEE
jgi:haloalkane dehalogenase